MFVRQRGELAQICMRIVVGRSGPNFRPSPSLGPWEHPILLASAASHIDASGSSVLLYPYICISVKCNAFSL